MFFRFKYFLLIVIPAITFSSCGLWNNFTTYFNLYYNTSDIFEDAEKQIKEQKKELFSTKELPVPGSVNTQLVKVVEKCSEILQFHSESAYVDDALLMLGKAFYYQKNYLKALRKFEELLATQDEESEFILETRLWIGKTQMKLKNSENALTILNEVREQAVLQENEEILKDAFVEEIVYRISEEDYQEAILLSTQLLEKSYDDDIKAEVLFEVGKLYLEVNESDNAIEAFRNVLEYNPLYEIELGAKLELAKSLRIAGKKEEALEVFNDMRDEVKFSEAYGEVDLQTGITLKELGRTNDALEKLVLVDTSYANTAVSSIAKFKLGEIYEYDFGKYDTAGSYYQKSLTSTLPVEYQTDVAQKIRTFKKYQHVKSQLNNFSSQLFYIENPEEFENDSLEFVIDSATYVQDSLEVIEELSLFSEHIQSLTRLDTTSYKDTVAVADSLRDSTIVLDSTQLDSIRQREREIAIKNEIAKQGLNIDSLFAEKWDKERKFPVKPVKSKLSEDSLKSVLAKNEIELGNLFLTEMELFDSAYYYYDHVLTYYPKTSHQANALYALGSYYLNTNQKEKADSLFNYIYENYKSESIVNAAANKINKPLVDLDYDPAKEIYSEAEYELLNDDYESSFEKFYSIYRIYPRSPVAPKALFTSGWILENELNLFDSAAVVYDTLSVRYPQSEFTSRINPKLREYKQYQAELQKAVQDSIQRIESETFNLISEDSLGINTDSTNFQRPPEGEVFNPDSEYDEIRTIKSPDIKLPSDTSRSAILDNPRRNPRKK